MRITRTVGDETVELDPASGTATLTRRSAVLAGGAVTVAVVLPRAATAASVGGGGTKTPFVLGDVSAVPDAAGAGSAITFEESAETATYVVQVPGTLSTWSTRCTTPVFFQVWSGRGQFTLEYESPTSLTSPDGSVVSAVLPAVPFDVDHYLGLRATAEDALVCVQQTEDGGDGVTSVDPPVLVGQTKFPSNVEPLLRLSVAALFTPA